MFDKREPLDFLKRMTFFRRAAKAGSDTYDNLFTEYQKVKEDQRLAIPVTQKLSAYYGLSGLYLYIPLKLEALQIAKTQDHDIIGQELTQLLSLVLYMQKYAASDEEKSWIENQKATCQKLCDSVEKEEVFHEAEDMAGYYSSLSPSN